MYWECCQCNLAINERTVCPECQHKRCSLFCWSNPKASASEESQNHDTTITADTVEASSPAAPYNDESEDEDAEEEDTVDGYLLAATILSYDQLPHGHTIKKDTPYKACCSCHWCPNENLEATQCLNCDHGYCEDCKYVQYVSDAEIEEEKASNGGPTYGQIADGTTTGDVEADKDGAESEYSETESEYSKTESKDFFAPLPKLNPVNPISTQHHITAANLGITPKIQAPFWECCQCETVKAAAETKCGDCTHPICHGCQDLQTADVLTKIEERKQGMGKPSRQQADAAVEGKSRGFTWRICD
ncbi:MAG: hypothetical protein Q9184_005291 [Pyrenodesmia sp. 2 TL-2023]